MPTLILFAEQPETCQWIMCDKTYFVDVLLLIYYVI